MKSLAHAYITGKTNLKKQKKTCIQPVGIDMFKYNLLKLQFLDVLKLVLVYCISQEYVIMFWEFLHSSYLYYNNILAGMSVCWNFLYKLPKVKLLYAVKYIGFTPYFVKLVKQNPISSVVNYEIHNTVICIRLYVIMFLLLHILSHLYYDNYTASSIVWYIL